MSRILPTALAATAILLGVAACRADQPLSSLRAAQQAPDQRCRNRSHCHLAFLVQPRNTHAGATITPPVQVAVQDPLGNTVQDFDGNVTVALEHNPDHAHLSGTRTVTAQAGVATFGDLSVDQLGRGYTLQANSGSLTPDESAPFAIIGPVTHLEFTVQPTNTATGAVITPAVFITPLDDLGTPDSDFTGAVTLAIGINPAAGTLSGTLTRASVPGGASFDDLSIDKAGAGYTLVASATGLPSVTSAPFDIVGGAATHLVFTLQPSNTTAGQPITPAVQVTAVDASGNADAGFTGPVTVAIAANPGGGTLSGTTTLVPEKGIATFSTLSIDKAGTGYRLSATAGALTPATSVAFTIVAGAATQLAFTAQPVTVTAGTTLPPVQVAALDAFGNTDPQFAVNVHLSITLNPGGGVLSGTATVAAFMGVATFSDLSIDKAGIGYQLQATAGGLISATSAAFDIVPGPATQLVFTVQPSNTAAGAVISPAVRVAAVDAFGNTATGFVADVTIAISANPGGGTLSGTTTVTPLAGVAIFGDLSIDKTGSGYQLSASTGGLTPATSAPFNVF
jgi:hypothetical protein